MYNMFRRDEREKENRRKDKGERKIIQTDRDGCYCERMNGGRKSYYTQYTPFSSGTAGSSTHTRNISVAQMALHCR